MFIYIAKEFMKILKFFFIFLSIFLLTTSLTEYILVDKYFVLYSIDWKVKTMYFVFLLTLFAFLESAEVFSKFRAKLLYTLFLFIISLAVFRIQSINHNKIINTPFIKSVNYTKVIQGDLIEVRGRGFGEIWKERKIYIGDIELIAKIWEDNLIIAEIPVPQKFYKDNLFINGSLKESSNSIEIEIFDPTPVLMGEINIR